MLRVPNQSSALWRSNSSDNSWEISGSTCLLAASLMLAAAGVKKVFSSGSGPLESLGLLVERAESSENSSAAWSELGDRINPLCRVVIGKAPIGPIDCHRQALRLLESPANWVDLARSLGESSAVESGGCLFNRKDCYSMALTIDPTCLSAEIGFSSDGNIEALLERVQKSCLASKEKARILLDLGRVNHVGWDIYCFARALEWDPKCLNAWIELARTLKRNESICIGKNEVTKKDCYEQVLRLDPEYIKHLESSIEFLSDEGRRNGYKMILDIHPNSLFAWKGLGSCLREGDEDLVPPVKVTKKKCAWIALQLSQGIEYEDLLKKHAEAVKSRNLS
jgi:hypothetical protein